MKRSILMLEHDDDDRYITQTVFAENDFSIKIDFVDNSDNLFAFLDGCERNLTPYPGLILLNYYAGPLNAAEIVKRLKSTSRCAHIPVVILSGTMSDDILRKCYATGANSFILKPSSGEKLNDKIRTFVRYWFETAELP